MNGGSLQSDFLQNKKCRGKSDHFNLKTVYNMTVRKNPCSLFLQSINYTAKLKRNENSKSNNP